MFPNRAHLLATFPIVIVIAFLGCHSKTKRSLAMQVADDSSSLNWLNTYKNAQTEVQAGHPEQACKLFKSLADQENFPARQIANLRAWENCPQTMPLTEQPTYLAPLALDIRLRVAQAQKDRQSEMDLAAEKSRQRLLQKDKIKWVKLAIERAAELKDDKKGKELTQRLYNIAPRLNPNPAEKDFLAVATDFRNDRQFDKARDYYNRVIHSSDAKLDDKVQAFKGLRLTEKNARKLDTHLEVCHRLVEFLLEEQKQKPKSATIRSLLYDAQIFEGRALWTQGRSKEARHIFSHVQKSMRGRISLAELYWLKARMAEEDKDFAKVAFFIEKALRERNNDSGLRDKILWYNAWNERRQEHYDKAASGFADLESKTQDEFVKIRALFWLGKSLADDKKADAAKSVFQRVIENDPLGYYGLLAHRQMDLAISIKISERPEDESATQTLPLDSKLADWLGLLDEKEALTSLLDEAATAYRKTNTQNELGWLHLLRHYARAGLYVKLYEGLANLSPDQRRSVLEIHPGLLFPQPWSDEVRAASLQFEVQPELIYSIMRQESAFDPQARSLADAFGLLQVLPEVAENLSTNHKIPYKQMDDLFDPRTNIHVGAAHLRELFKKYNNQFILAVAAYNANDSAIRNWVKTRYRGDALEFIEEIPYEETRTYVRLVMRNLIFYSLLNSKSAAIEFPTWVLKL